MGYLSKVKSGDNHYIYLTEYIPTQEYTTKNEQHVFAFGNAKRALFKMRHWKRNPSSFPEELRRRGYTICDVDRWLKTMKTGKTPTGKKFEVIYKNRAAF